MEGRHHLALLQFCQRAASVGGGCLAALSIEGTPSEPWAAPLPGASLLLRKESHWLDRRGPSGSQPPRAGLAPSGVGCLPPPASTQSGFFPGEGLRPISPAPWRDVVIYQKEVSPLVRPQAWTGKPREQGQMYPHGPAGPGDPTLPGNTGSASHWAPNLGSREVTCIGGPDG